MLSNWIPVDVLPALKDGEVQLWQIQLSGATGLSERYSTLLSPSEQAHASRFRHGQAREHFTVGRACLKILLGNALAVDSRSITIETGPNGKPETRLLDGDNIFFNVAHSKNTILIALSRQGLVGVDVEYLDRLTDMMEVARSNFTEGEIASLTAIAELGARNRAFYRYWTRKEAVAKADGRGLLLSLSSFDISHDSTSLHPVRLSESSDGEGKLFFVSDLDLGDQAAGALALESPSCEVSRLIFPLDVLQGRPDR
jgi:4'-phosphopantetheinyl transferase